MWRGGEGRVARRLAWRGLRKDWGRALCGALGVAGAVGVLSWHVGLAWTLRGAGGAAARAASAPFEAWVTAEPGPGAGPGGQRSKVEGRRSGEEGNGERVVERAEATMGRRMAGGGGRPLPPGVAESLRGTAGVKRVLELRTVGASLDVRPGGRVLQGPPFRATVAGLAAGGIPFAAGRLSEGRLPEEGGGAREVVANAGMFGRRVPKPELGAELPAVLARGTVGLTVVGFFEMNDAVGAFPTMYGNAAAMEALERAEGMRGGGGRRGGGGANLALVEMEPGADVGRLAGALEGADGGRGCRLYTTRAVAERYRSDAVKNALGAMGLSLSMATLTAACLLATVLWMGVQADRRKIAVLRCAGMTRRGVARWMAAETGLPLAAGWALGLGGAWAALQAFLASEAAAGMPSVARFGWATPAAGAGLAGVVGLLAGWLPLRSALRVKPLEMRGGGGVPGGRVSGRRAALGAALLAPMPLISVAGIGEGAKTWLALGVGMPCLAAGMWLLLPGLMRATEWAFCGMLGRVLGLDGRLLQRRLSREPRRVAGVALTLALGLGGYVAVHIWGGTLMASFVPSPEWPDVIVSALPNGLSAAEVESVRGCDGVRDGRVLTLDCTQKPIEAVGAGKTRNPEGVVLFFGADPVAAFGGEHPLMDLRFTEGEREAAVAAMAEGRGCVIMGMLSRMTGLHVGDRIRAAGRELEVSGVAELNWHLVTSRALVRTRFGNEAGGGGGPGARTAGMAFVGEKWVREVTGNERTYFLWADLSDELRAAGGLAGSMRLDGQIRAAVGDGDGRNAIQVHHRDEIADGTLAHGNDIIGTMARVPFWSLAVTSLGIAALLAASARSGRREFDTMRAVGMTRGQLRRLLMGEGLLTGLCAAVAGVLGGGLAGWSFTGISRWMMSAGLAVKLSVPWGMLAQGGGFELSLCVAMGAAGVWAATGRGGKEKK